MNGHLVETKTMSLMNSWYLDMRAQKPVQSLLKKEELDEKIDQIKEDRKAYSFYLLLDYRYKLLINDLNCSLNVEENNLCLNKQLTYFYYLFQAIHATYVGSYISANKYFKEAKKYLGFTSDEIERAEFGYRLAIFYNHIQQPLLSAYEAFDAQKLFDQSPGHEINSADCDNLLGLSYISQNQFKQAQKHLLNALGTARNRGHKNLTFRVRYSLGLMFAEQDLSRVAIRHLNHAYEKELKDYKIIFLLARENHKLGNVKIVREFIKKGLTICKTQNIGEYQHHFLILQEMNNLSPINKIEAAIRSGIRYFEREGLFGYIQDYSKYIAGLFYELCNYRKAGYYYHLAYEARQKQLKIGTRVGEVETYNNLSIKNHRPL